MTDSAALLADEVLRQKPLRQWVLSLPIDLRFLRVTDAKALSQVLAVSTALFPLMFLRKPGSLAGAVRPAR